MAEKSYTPVEILRRIVIHNKLASAEDLELLLGLLLRKNGPLVAALKPPAKPTPHSQHRLKPAAKIFKAFAHPVTHQTAKACQWLVPT